MTRCKLFYKTKANFDDDKTFLVIFTYKSGGQRKGLNPLQLSGQFFIPPRGAHKEQNMAKKAILNTYQYPSNDVQIISLYFKEFIKNLVLLETNFQFFDFF